MEKFNSDKSDMHIHTLASDGHLLPLQIIKLAVKEGVKNISITDHDSIKSYKDNKNNYFEIAKKKGVSLISGIEMDSKYNDIEVHILGYDIDINNKKLNEYLSEVADTRKKRIFEQIDEINKKKGIELIKREDIIDEKRDIYMKPHLILRLLKTREFGKYKYSEINSWLKNNIKVSTIVEKPDSKLIVKMIKEAGGKAFLAHPGYYLFYEPLDLNELIIELKNAGLDGLEYQYPYNGPGSNIDSTKEKEIIEKIKKIAKTYDLFLSRGSDAHDEKRFVDFNNKPY